MVNIFRICTICVKASVLVYTKTLMSGINLGYAIMTPPDQDKRPVVWENSISQSQKPEGRAATIISNIQIKIIHFILMRFNLILGFNLSKQLTF